MTQLGDGDGWVTCTLGHRHWGRYGAAGLLIRTADELVLQHRAPWSHHGDTWGLPGGARDSHESACTAALREAAEEAGVDPGSVRITGVHTDDHGGWSYATVLAESIAPVRPVSANAESVEVRWQPVRALDRLRLHPGFATSWPALRAAFPPPQLIVDAANVVGSRPDGWWSDRPGAARRLYDEVVGWAITGLDASAWPQRARYEALTWLFPRVTIVVEGAARALSAPVDTAVRVVRAAGSGDDTIVDVARERPNSVVVTADRELRRRVSALGADVVGPRWLWTAMD